MDPKFLHRIAHGRSRAGAPAADGANGDVRVNIADIGRTPNLGVSKVPQLLRHQTRRLSGHQTNSLTGWLYDNLICLVEPASQRVRTSVLDLFDQVFVTLLRESSAFFSVKVDVVTPHLQRVEVSVRGRQVEVNSDFVVLQGNQWQGQSWVSVKEEDQWQVNLFVVHSRRSHLTVVQLLGFVHVQFRVQSPPLLVVLVDSLTTDGQFDSGDRGFRDPRIFSKLVEGLFAVNSTYMSAIKSPFLATVTETRPEPRQYR